MSLASVPSLSSFLDFETFRNTPVPSGTSALTLNVNTLPWVIDLPLLGETRVGGATCARAGAATSSVAAAVRTARRLSIPRTVRRGRPDDNRGPTLNFRRPGALGLRAGAAECL